MLQTLFLNMFFGGQLKGMPPKLVSDDGRHVVIRPLAYVAENDLDALGRAPRSSRSSRAPCAAARTTCSASRSAQMLREWDRKHPGRVDTMFTALQNVVPSHLADGTHYDFKGLTVTGVASEDGDKAFDPQEFPAAASLPGLQVIKL